MISVVTIQDQVIQENLLFKDVKKAEKHFLDRIKDLAKLDGIKLTKEDLNNILSDGYFELKDGSICISTPEIKS